MTQQPLPQSTTPNTTASTPQLAPIIKQNIASLTCQHLTKILADALRIARQSKRSILTDAHLAIALRSNNASLPLSSGSGSGGSSSRNSSNNNNNVDLNALVRSDVLNRQPVEPGLCVHWLAIEGVQPLIPMNGAGVTTGFKRKFYTLNNTNTDGIISNNGTKNQNADRLNLSVRQLLPHLLSEELQLYFQKITLAIESGTIEEQVTALGSVRSDAGMQELVPFFVKFISQQILRSLDRTEYARTLVRLTDALISNVNLHLELHLHHLFPAIITCVIARRLSATSTDDHWSLRMEAALVLVRACDKYSEQYTTLKSRVIKSHVEALAPGRPFASQFGGIVGITAFGTKAVEAFLLNVAVSYWDKWKEDESKLMKIGDDATTRTSSTVGDTLFEIRQCQTALLNALGVYAVQGSSLFEQVNYMDTEAFMDRFSEKLIPFQYDEMEYSYGSCFL